jgi:NAD(P)-dependent dehydrogenase (short-subunit alcohol dehydrogenase family)
MRTGETVLVTAAAGGTGMFAVQLAKLAGNHVVATCSSPAKVRPPENSPCVALTPFVQAGAKHETVVNACAYTRRLRQLLLHLQSRPSAAAPRTALPQWSVQLPWG